MPVPAQSSRALTISKAYLDQHDCEAFVRLSAEEGFGTEADWLSQCNESRQFCFLLRLYE